MKITIPKFKTREWVIPLLVIVMFIFLNPLFLNFLEDYFTKRMTYASTWWVVYSINLLIVGIVCILQPVKVMRWIYKKDNEEQLITHKRKLLVWIGLAFVLVGLFHFYSVYSWWVETHLAI
jgi:hypothetical protein